MDWLEVSVRTSHESAEAISEFLQEMGADGVAIEDSNVLHQDFEKWLENLAPHLPTKQYSHNDTGEDNADAHLKRQIMGRETVVAITKGKLDFGPWEQIFYGEFDGCRNKKVLVKVIGE